MTTYTETFGTPQASNWGAGFTLIDGGDPSTFSVSSGQGHIAQSTSNSFSAAQWTTPGSLTAADITVTVQSPADGGGLWYADLFAMMPSGALTGYNVGVTAASGVLQVEIYSVASGGFSFRASGNSGVLFAANTAYKVRMRAYTEGTSSYVVGRVWEAAATEPSTWHATWQDTAQTYTSGYVAVGSEWLTSGSNTTSFDDLTVVDSVIAGASISYTAIDTFTRTVSDDLGTRDDGGSYALTDAGSLYDVDGTKAIITATGGGYNFDYPATAAIVSDILFTYTDFVIDVQVPSVNNAVVNGGWVYCDLFARYEHVDAFYLWRIRFDQTTTPQRFATDLYVKNNTATMTWLATENFDLGVDSIGRWFSVRLQVSGSNPSRIKGKIWETGTTEPGSWQLEYSDSTAAVQGDGWIGFGVLTDLPDPSDYPLYMWFDNLRTASLTACTIVDDFTRTASGTWGSGWDLAYADATAFSVGSGIGTIQNALASNSFNPARYLTLPPNDVLVSCDVQFGTLGGSDVQGLFIANRWQAASPGRAYLAYASASGTTSAPELIIYREDMSTLANVIARTSMPAPSAGTWYRLHIHCQDTYPTTITAYWTDTSNTVLASVTVTDSDPQWQVYGYAGVGQDYNASNAGYAAYFDNLRFCGVVSPVTARIRLQVI